MGIRCNKLLFLLPLLCCFFSAGAQNITGIWRGYFITDQADQYKVEVQVAQSNKKTVTGVSYSYLTTVFYGKATMIGNVNTATHTALLQEIKTVELRMSGAGSVACIMKYNLQYSKSGDEEFLEGTYTSTYEKSNLDMAIKRGGNCGGGKVFLRKVPTSDFYVEPFLRTRPGKQNEDEAKVITPKPTTPKPVTKAPVTTTPAKPIAKTPANKQAPPVKKSIAITAAPKEDTVKRITTAPVATQPPPVTVEKPALKIPAVTRARQNELLQTINVTNRDITVKLYDNGEIDGDSISIYLDNKLVLANQMLTAAPITLHLKVTDDEPEHVLVMVAENMGRIPPNTSLMIVYDGEKRYEVRIISTEQKNAMVRFRYQKP